MAHKILTCTGFGNTGSSAATNFFEEFSNVHSVGGSEFECTILHEADGIIDLYKAVTEGDRLKTDLAIKRFRKLVYTINRNNPSGRSYADVFHNTFLDHAEKYLSSLNILTWQGNWHRVSETAPYNQFIQEYKAHKFDTQINKKKYELFEPDSWRPSFTKREPMYYCGISRNDFVTVTKQFLNSLFDECDPENKYEYLLFDQLVPTNCSNEHTQFFDDIHVIVVDRDPRDLYFGNRYFWNNGFIPTADINTFINWYKTTRSFCKPSSSTLIIQFEEFIFRNKELTTKLLNFTGMSEKKRTHAGEYLQPEKSIKNTRLWLQYTILDKQERTKVLTDISQIENELSNFCFTYTSEEIISVTDSGALSYATEEKALEIASKKVHVLAVIFYNALKNTSYYKTKGSRNFLKKILSFLVLPLEFIFRLGTATIKFEAKEIIVKHYGTAN